MSDRKKPDKPKIKMACPVISEFIAQLPVVCLQGLNSVKH